MKVFFGIFLIMGLGFSVFAQSPADLKASFEGKQVTFRIDMPATNDGVSLYPERAQSLDYIEYNKRLRNHGAAFHRGELATITGVRISDNSIEVRFGKTARFNVHFARIESWMLTPATLIDALNRYVAFTESDKSSAQLKPSSDYATGYVRNGVVHVGPRTTYLKEGLKTREVVKLLGEPSAVTERLEAGRAVAVYEFKRGEGRVLIAEFVGDALVSSRTETRTVAVLNRSTLTNP